MLLRLEGPLAEATAAWALLSDPDHLNRQAASPPLTFDLEAGEDGFPVLSGELLGPIGLRHRFEEVDHRWVVGQSLRFCRQIEGPLLRELRFEATLERRGEGVIPRLELELRPRSALVEPLVSLGLAATGRAWQRCLRTLPTPGTTPAPAALRQLDHAVTAAFVRWKAGGAPAPVVHRLRRLLEAAPLWSLSELRPALLALRWGLPRAVVQDAFIEAVGAGLLELRWQARCPRCALACEAVEALSLLREAATCGSCQSAFPVDLRATVEAVFCAPASLAPRGEPGFATWFPARRPEVAALSLLPPGGQDQIELDLDPGLWQIVASGGHADQALIVLEDGPVGPLRWTPLPTPTSRRTAAGRVTLQLHNDSPARCRVLLCRQDHGGAPLPALRLVTSGLWRARFGVPALAPAARFEVSEVTVLFTDLTDSTAFYLDQGDRQALSFVVAHFALLDAAVDAAGGTRVKTTGDSMLAAFYNPEDALRAALAAHAAHDRHSRATAAVGAPRLRIGLHRGPALAMHTDTAGLDYFGSTVSIANRAVDAAVGGSVVWTERVAESSAVQALLVSCALQPERQGDIAPGLGLWAVHLDPRRVEGAGDVG